ncbi:hypothetical protein [Sphingomonas sp. UYP23]
MTAQIEAEWLAHRLSTMRRLKKPTLPQSIILELAELAELMPTDRRRLWGELLIRVAAV